MTASGPGGDAFDDVAAELNPAVGNDAARGVSGGLRGRRQKWRSFEALPAPEIMRVVQIEPAPIPTLMTSAPALIKVSGYLRLVTTLPAITGRSFQADLIF